MDVETLQAASLALPVRVALAGSGIFLMAGLLTGVWKYAKIAQSPSATAPVYVDIAHRAALMYAFASLVIAALAWFSPWSPTVTLWAVAAPLLFFALAILSYIFHGVAQDTDNQFRHPHRMGSMTLPGVLLHGFMWLLMAAEIGGVGILLAGALSQLF